MCLQSISAVRVMLRPRRILRFHLYDAMNIAKQNRPFSISQIQLSNIQSAATLNTLLLDAFNPRL